MPDLRALLRELAMWKEKRGRAILAKLFHFQPHFVLRHHVCHSSFGPITKPTNRFCLFFDDLFRLSALAARHR